MLQLLLFNILLMILLHHVNRVCSAFNATIHGGRRAICLATFGMCCCRVLVERDHVVVVAAQAVRVQRLTRMMVVWMTRQVWWLWWWWLSHGTAAKSSNVATVEFVETVAVRSAIVLIKGGVTDHFGLFGHHSIRERVVSAMTRFLRV